MKWEDGRRSIKPPALSSITDLRGRSLRILVSAASKRPTMVYGKLARILDSGSDVATLSAAEIMILNQFTASLCWIAAFGKRRHLRQRR